MLYQLSYLATREVRAAQREHTGRDETEMIPRRAAVANCGLRE